MKMANNLKYNHMSTSDDYMTPPYAWENIARFLPKDKVCYEPFYGDGKSGEMSWTRGDPQGHRLLHKHIRFRLRMYQPAVLETETNIRRAESDR